MLFLSRKVAEGVVFDGPGRVIIVSVSRSSGKVKLGFEADPSTTIDRDEIARQKGAEHSK